MSLTSTTFSGQALAFKTGVPRAVNRTALAVQAKFSRIGKVPITVPSSVTVKLDGQAVHVKGPKGELQRVLPGLVTVQQDGNVVRVERAEESRKANQMHGLCRTLVNNMVVGVSDGFTKQLSLVGVGYRAAVAGGTLTLNLGYSHPVEMPIPKGVEVKVEKNTTVFVSGYDKEVVGQFAATIRGKREPEPYKGKGVRYHDEVVRRKEGKRGK
ncbi:hypothetical protein N2152v2_008087 [Parachlorella kessleri]